MGFESGAGAFMQGGSYSAAQMRRAAFAWAARTSANQEGTIAGGLLSATDMQLSAAASGLVVNTSVGACIIGGSEASNQGGYHAFLSSTNSTTLATANATNPRVDIICATVGDPDYTLPSGATSGQVTIQAVTGTPTSGASLSNLSGVGTLPGSSLLLGYVLVPAAATSLTSGDIANKAVLGLPSFNGRIGPVEPQNGDYVLGATGAAPGIARGIVALTWPGAQTYSDFMTVTHGLSSAPISVVASAYLNGVFASISDISSATFVLQANYVSYQPPAGALGYAFWIAML